MPETTTTRPAEEGLSAGDLDHLVRRWLDLEVARAHLVEEQAGIKARLRHTLTEGTHRLPSGAKVTVSPNRRFDLKRAENVIPAELRHVVEVTVIDAKKARENLPPALYDACRTESGDPRVVIA